MSLARVGDAVRGWGYRVHAEKEEETGFYYSAQPMRTVFVCVYRITVITVLQWLIVSGHSQNSIKSHWFVFALFLSCTILHLLF